MYIQQAALQQLEVLAAILCTTICSLIRAGGRSVIIPALCRLRLMIQKVAAATTSMHLREVAMDGALPSSAALPLRARALAGCAMNASGGTVRLASCRPRPNVGTSCVVPASPRMSVRLASYRPPSLQRSIPEECRSRYETLRLECATAQYLALAPVATAPALFVPSRDDMSEVPVGGVRRKARPAPVLGAEVVVLCSFGWVRPKLRPSEASFPILVKPAALGASLPVVKRGGVLSTG